MQVPAEREDAFTAAVAAQRAGRPVEAMAAAYGYVREATVDDPRYDRALRLLALAAEDLGLRHAASLWFLEVARGRRAPALLPEAIRGLQRALQGPHDADALVTGYLAVADIPGLPEDLQGFVDFQQGLAEGPMRRSTLDSFVTACVEAADLLARNVDRAAHQVAQFKQVAVDQTSERRRQFDLAATLEEVVAALTPHLRLTSQHIELDIPEGIELDSYPGPLEQVISNLVGNALTHAFTPDQAGTIRISARPEGDGGVCIEVADDGRGMPPEVVEHAFDPFFTTRLGKGGSGLGLYIAYTLVAGLLGGSIRLESTEGAGCRFLIHLPLQVPASPVGHAPERR